MQFLSGCLNQMLSQNKMNAEFMLWKIDPRLVLYFIRKHFYLVCKELMKHTKSATFHHLCSKISNLHKIMPFYTENGVPGIMIKLCILEYIYIFSTEIHRKMNWHPKPMCIHCCITV